MKGNTSYSILSRADEAQVLQLLYSHISRFTLILQLPEGLFLSFPTAASAVNNHGCSSDAFNTNL